MGRREQQAKSCTGSHQLSSRTSLSSNLRSRNCRPQRGSRAADVPSGEGERGARGAPVPSSSSASPRFRPKVKPPLFLSASAPFRKATPTEEAEGLPALALPLEWSGLVCALRTTADSLARPNAPGPIDRKARRDASLAQVCSVQSVGSARPARTQHSRMLFATRWEERLCWLPGETHMQQVLTFYRLLPARWSPRSSSSPIGTLSAWRQKCAAASSPHPAVCKGDSAWFP